MVSRKLFLEDEAGGAVFCFVSSWAVAAENNRWPNKLICPVIMRFKETIPADNNYHTTATSKDSFVGIQRNSLGTTFAL